MQRRAQFLHLQRSSFGVVSRTAVGAETGAVSALTVVVVSVVWTTVGMAWCRCFGAVRTGFVTVASFSRSCGGLAWLRVGALEWFEQVARRLRVFRRVWVDWHSFEYLLRRSTRRVSLGGWLSEPPYPHTQTRNGRPRRPEVKCLGVGVGGPITIYQVQTWELYASACVRLWG